jgi:hypothetical protein
MTTLSWKDKVNNRGAWSFTARAPRIIGGNYVISQFMHCWNVDYHKKKARTQRQLGFACTIEDAKAVAEQARASAEADYETANKGQ